MKSIYKVHKYENEKDIDPIRLEEFLNSLEGEVQAIIPNLGRSFNPIGVYANIKYLLIVEKTKDKLL